MKNSMQLIVCALLFTCLVGSAQDEKLNGVYLAMEESFGNIISHEIKFGDTYSTHTEYQVDPPFFIKAQGGFYKQSKDSILVLLEFNSDFAKDSVTTRRFGYKLDGNTLIINGNEDRVYQKQVAIEQDLDGTWLFGTRGPDIGQERRGDSRDRKTLKFLIDGRFQWIAYNVADFRFMGTGGGNYTARDGKYSEQIEYFSRDNARVGATLDFIYTVHEGDWHHIGNNSRGDPMYEIWMQRRR